MAELQRHTQTTLRSAAVRAGRVRWIVSGQRWRRLGVRWAWRPLLGKSAHVLGKRHKQGYPQMRRLWRRPQEAPEQAPISRFASTIVVALPLEEWTPSEHKKAGSPASCVGVLEARFSAAQNRRLLRSQAVARIGAHPHRASLSAAAAGAEGPLRASRPQRLHPGGGPRRPPPPPAARPDRDIVVADGCAPEGRPCICVCSVWWARFHELLSNAAWLVAGRFIDARSSSGRRWTE